MPEYMVRVYRLGDPGPRRFKDSKMISESSWNTDEDVIEDIAEYAGRNDRRGDPLRLRNNGGPMNAPDRRAVASLLIGAVIWLVSMAVVIIAVGKIVKEIAHESHSTDSKR